MNPFVTLRNIVFWLATRALQVHDAVSRIPLVSNIFGTFFYNVSSWCFDIGLSLGDLASWYQRVTDRISTWLTSLDVLSIMSTWIARVNQVWVWLGSWWGNVQSAISNWWEGTRITVLAWVQTAKDYTTSLYITLKQDISSLGVKWDSFWTVTLPSLATKKETDDSVKQSLLPWAGLFSFWTNFGKSVVSFFGDPAQWVYDRLDNFFERFW